MCQILPSIFHKVKFTINFYQLVFVHSSQVLRVDQIIMAKRAGGPKARGMGKQDPDDDE